MFRKFLQVALCFFLLTSVFMASAETIELGGPRKVVAELVSQGDVWNVTLRMVPVKCFDQAMNAKVQKQLGCDYALSALAQLLHSDALAVAYCRCEGMSEGNGIVTMKIRIGGVRRKVNTAMSSGKQPALSSLSDGNAAEIRQGSLLSSAEDWSHVIANFKQAVLGEGAKVFAHMPLDDENDLILAEWENDFRNGYRSMQEKLKADIELLTMERDELLLEADQAAEEILEQMKRYGELLGNANRFQNVNLDSAYASALLAEPLLMETGGANVLTAIDGARMVVSVGIAEIRKPSSQESIRQRKVAQTRAEGQLVSWLKSRVNVQTTMKEKVFVIQDDSGVTTIASESFEEIIRESAEGVISGLQPIGTWTSKDNQIFYLAVGRLL
ncbi:MAG: hypothetical protein J6X55_18050 [Victivallales bacterium]|nr:hypothetical protein [Victivallales bacterium]